MNNVSSKVLSCLPPRQTRILEDDAATARSDTFVIRSYGEAHGNSGETSAKAVCEAVIQRLPDWVDPTDKAATAPANLVSPKNQTLGRGFRVIAFRWLNDDEI